jgi:hypothetical protein
MSSKKKFVIIACPRTGTNHFIALLNSAPGMCCHSEVFHKHSVFFKCEAKPELMRERDADPIGFLNRLYETTDAEAVGFKIFIDHNDKVLEHCIDDPEIACIVLYRHNFLAAHSSNLIATQNKQYVVTDDAARTPTQVEFKRDVFEFHYRRYQKFYAKAVNRLNKRRKPFLFFQYSETLCQPLVQQAFSFLGCPIPEHVGTKMKKINSSHILSRFSNPQVAKDMLVEKGMEEWTYESFVGLDPLF